MSTSLNCTDVNGIHRSTSWKKNHFVGVYCSYKTVIFWCSLFISFTVLKQIYFPPKLIFFYFIFASICALPPPWSLLATVRVLLYILQLEPPTVPNVNSEGAESFTNEKKKKMRGCTAEEKLEKKVTGKWLWRLLPDERQTKINYFVFLIWTKKKLLKIFSIDGVFFTL